MTETNSQNSMVSVPFDGDQLFLVEHRGEPFTPLKPIISAIGIDWDGQRQKLLQNNKRWSAEEISAVAGDGKNRDMLCIPVRKLPAFLATIQPGKVAPELREKIERYQNECDDALWAYWTKGRAENPRAEAVPGALDRTNEIFKNLVARIDSLQEMVLIAKPRWKKIYGYRSIGLNLNEIGKLLDISGDTVRCHLKLMETCGIIPTVRVTRALLTERQLTFEEALS